MAMTLDKALEWVKSMASRAFFVEPVPIEKTLLVQNIEAKPLKAVLPYHLFGKATNGTCHGCKHFKGQGPLEKRYRPEGECMVPTNKEVDRNVTWKTPACRLYSGWGMWCDHCGAAIDFNKSLSCPCRNKYQFR